MAEELILESQRPEQRPFQATWRTIPSFPDYEVNSVGQVQRIKHLVNGRTVCRAMKQHLHNGYYWIRLSYRSVGVHVLVTEAFHGPRPSPAHRVAHADGTRTNNVPSNLRWATQVENEADKKRHGRTPSGERHPMASLTLATVQAIRDAYKHCGDRGQQARLCQQFGISSGHMSSIIRGKYWK